MTVGVQAWPTDPRDATSEIVNPEYRVCTFSGSAPRAGSASDEYRVTAPDVQAVIEWAQAQTPPGGQFVVYAIHREPSHAEVTALRLLGTDPNDVDHSE